MNKHIRTKATRECPKRIGMYFNPPEGSGGKTARITWCCRIRGQGAIFIAGMRCIGRTHPDCPLMKLDNGEPERKDGEA